MFSQIDLKYRIAACSENLPQTDELQRRIKIGVDFHGKWYRTQREHWLGWIVAKEYEALKNGIDPASVPAKVRWRYLHCIPMMFWLAEAAGLDQAILEIAVRAAVDAVAKYPQVDCSKHGKPMRDSIPWEKLDTALLAGPIVPAIAADTAADAAFEHLAEKVADFRTLRKRAGSLPRHAIK